MFAPRTLSVLSFSCAVAALAGPLAASARRIRAEQASEADWERGSGRSSAQAGDLETYEMVDEEMVGEVVDAERAIVGALQGAVAAHEDAAGELLAAAGVGCQVGYFFGAACGWIWGFGADVILSVNAGCVHLQEDLQ